jgi:hypothetical protein
LKKFLPYLFALIVVLLLLLVVFQTKRNTLHVLDERISFNKKEKIPYGMYVAYNNLSRLFPEASIIVNKKEPAFWDSLNSYSDKQALIIITPRFMADEFELNRLLNFARAGNNIFISTRMLSSEAQNFFNCQSYLSGLSFFDNVAENDTMSLALLSPPFPESEQYNYPGKQYDGYFGKYDDKVTYVLGQTDPGKIDFIRLRAGTGNIYVHLAPLAFSNYFLLHKQNINYYNKALSVIPADTKKLVWDEYFLRKRYASSGGEGSNKSMLSALMSQRSFRFALTLLIILLVLFILQEMRRKQRIIPVMAKPKNDSLDFVKTVGRLYHEKRDNRNLSRKMAAYFLDHVRNRYKLATNTLDERFIQLLKMKSGESEENTRSIVSFIKYIEDADAVDDEQLAEFHKQLEAFYKNA